MRVLGAFKGDTHFVLVNLKTVHQLDLYISGFVAPRIKSLAQSGLLTRERQGNQALYQADRSCSIFEELAAIFRKTVGLATILKHALSPLANRIQLAFVFGSMASGKQHAHNGLDICILGDLELLEVVKALGSVQETFQREINPVVMSTNRFIDQLANHDRFAECIFDELKVYVIGDDDEFAKLAQPQ